MNSKKNNKIDTKMISSPRCYSYIRFSTPEQLKGNSLLRQLELSKKYAEENGFHLDESLTMKDLGLSAFSGEHRKRGALGIFLNMVKQSKVPKNSVLLVESLDRISREQVLDAFDQFREIIKSGIKIVTLADGMEYSEKTLNANIGQLMISLTIMSRAYEESLQKSKRLSAAWNQKRKQINEKILTKRCSAWLYFDERSNGLMKIDDRCKLIKRIFRLSFNGHGIKSIAKTLNMEQIPAWRSKNGWHGSYIFKILHNRVVLGELQPYKLNNGKREPVGEPISDYYPRVISDKLFYQVQERLKSNALMGGKTGNIRNLFGGLAKCAYCGAPMQFVNKGKPPKGGTYLVCDSARRGLGCKYLSFRYPDFEKAVLTFCSELNVQDLLTGDDDHRESKISAIQGEITGINGNLEVLKNKIANLGVALEDENRKELQELLKNNLAKVFDNQNILISQKEELEHQLNELRNSKHEAKTHIKALKELLLFLEREKGEKLLDVRLKLRAELRQLIDKIVVFPASYTSDEKIKSFLDLESKWLRSKNPGMGQSELASKIKQIEKQLKERQIDKKWRGFTINFKNGNFRVVTPQIDDLSKFIVKAEKDGDSLIIGD
jgi:DNA invertase Pin-like site-specific DNA recombinase